MIERSEVEEITRTGSLKPAKPAHPWQKNHFWVIAALFIAGILLQYPQQLLGISQPSLLYSIEANRLTAETMFFLIPIFYTGFAFGMWGGVISLILSLAIILPRIIWISDNQPEAFLELGLVLTAGLMMTLWLEDYRREQKRRESSVETLQLTRQEAQQYVQALENSEKALETINAIGLVVSQSLDLQKVLETTVDRIREAMDLDVALAFLLNEQTNELELKAYRGVSQEFVNGLKGLKVGEGFNGSVVQTGETLVVANSNVDPRLTREVVKQEGILTQLIVPLKSRERVVGTLTVAGRYQRRFREDEIDLLSAIGRQVGIAIENSRLYQQERALAEEQKGMQERLRFYLQQVTRAQEEERKRIAQELHDDTIQNMVLLMHQIDRFTTSTGYLTPQQILFLEELRQRISIVSDEVRRFTQDLRPSILDDLGLLPTLDWLASDVTKNFDIAVNVVVTGQPCRFSPETESTLFRIAQEALRNVWKHSHAKMAQIKVEFSLEKVALTISDNGKGFEPRDNVDDLATSGKLGLVGMRERAQLIGAILTVKSQLDKGTSVIVEIPNIII
jgi:two-component system sensor histidine kinase DegS